jgi:hypothetical protein
MAREGAMRSTRPATERRGVTLGDLVRRAEDDLFVGREHEIATFDAWLASPGPALLLNITGVGGVGKTTLLRRFERLAFGRGWAVVSVAGGDVPASLSGVLRGMGVDSIEDAAARFAERPTLLALDAFDALESVTASIRDDLFAALPAGTRILVVGRRRLDARRWRGWLPVIDHIALAPLRQDESRDYLERRGLTDPAQVRTIAHATRGLPLALSVAADAAARGGTSLKAVPSDWTALLRTLVDDILAEVANDDLRLVVEAAAVLRRFDEDVLSAVLDGRPISGAFAELTTLSFVRSGRHGLAIHDEVKAMLIADLGVRSPDRLRMYRERAAEYYRARIGQPVDADWQLLLDGLSLQEPVRPGIPRPVDPSRSLVEPYRPEDRDEVLATQREFVDSPAGATLSRDERSEATLAHLLDWPETEMFVARTRSGGVHGYAFLMPICDASLALLPPDGQLRDAVITWLSGAGLALPATRAASRITFLSTIAARPPDVDEAMNALGEFGFSLVMRGGMFVAVAAQGSWFGQTMAAGGSELVGHLEPSVPGGPVLDVWVVDIDAFGVAEWTEAMIAGRPPRRRLRGAELIAAVQDALGNWRDDSHLAASPLLTTLPSTDATRESSPGALRALIRTALEGIRREGHELEARAIELAYLDRSGSVERVAERLHVSRSTLFRLLRKGTEALARRLAG